METSGHSRARGVAGDVEITMVEESESGISKATGQTLANPKKTQPNRSSVETGRRKFPGQTNLIIALGGMN